MIFPLFTLFAFFHKYDEGSFNKEFFCKRQTTTLKGIMIIVIFFHHFPQIVDGAEWVDRAYRNSQYSVATFFLLAGYTTSLRYIKTNKIDFKQVWINRCWRLYLPIILLTVSRNSFMDCLLFLFVCTDVVFARINNDNLKIVALLICNALFIFFCIRIGKRPYWYDDVFTYWIGVAVAFYKNDIIKFFTGVRYWISLIALSVLFDVSYYFAFYGRQYVYSTIILSTSAALIVFLIMMKLDIRSRFFEFIGRYSFEIFMSHQLIILLMNILFIHNSTIMFSSFLIIIIFSVSFQRAALLLKENWLSSRRSTI